MLLSALVPEGVVDEEIMLLGAQRKYKKFTLAKPFADVMEKLSCPYFSESEPNETWSHPSPLCRSPDDSTTEN